jgi:hypothetical protein
VNRITLLIAFIVLGALFADARAQGFYRTQYGNLAAIQNRAAQLNPPDKDLPDADQILYDEARRIDDELRELRGLRRDEPKDEQGILDSLKKEISATVVEIGGLDCKKTDVASLRRLILPFGKVQSYVSRKYFDELEAPQPNPYAGAFWFGPERPKFDSAFCRELKTYVGDQANQQILVGYLDKLLSSVAGEQKKFDDYKKAASDLTELLQKRRAAIQAKLASKATQQQIGSSLWAVILIIGGLSVLAIYAVKSFDPAIQMEWVASGQVIQFVTVMVLLSAVMALGLANVLKENTLGTLLGGIAGYVLAQGVGRAAAREMQRDLQGMSQQSNSPSSAKQGHSASAIPAAPNKATIELPTRTQNQDSGINAASDAGDHQR